MGVKVTRAREVTYLGVPAVVWEVRRGSSATGHRVGITKWLADADERNGGHKTGSVVLRHCVGDGRYIDSAHPASLVLHAEDVVLPPGTSDDAATRAALNALTGCTR